MTSLIISSSIVESAEPYNCSIDVIGTTFGIYVA